MSATTKARLTAPATARVSGMSSSIVTGQGRVVAENVVAGGVADEQEVDAGLVEDGCREHVVAREPGDLDPVLLRVLEVTGADLLGRRS